MTESLDKGLAQVFCYSDGNLSGTHKKPYLLAAAHGFGQKVVPRSGVLSCEETPKNVEAV